MKTNPIYSFTILLILKETFLISPKLSEKRRILIRLKEKERKMTRDPTIENFPEGNAKYLKDISVLYSSSDGEKLFGTFLKVLGPDLHPVVLFFYDFPKYEKNYDLAHVCRRAGWHIFLLHYRGFFMAPDIYSFFHALEDAGFSQILLDTNHHYSDKRVELSRVVTLWLSQQFKEAI